MEVVLFEVKGDHQDPSVARHSVRARRVPKKVIEISRAETEILKAEVLKTQTEKLAVPASNESSQADVAGSSSGADGHFGSAEGAEVSAQERYSAELRAMLERRKEYPILAKRLRQQGRVIVKFTLKRDGQVMKAEVIETSEFDSLNRAAEKLITSINGLKPFPVEVKKSEWVFVLPVVYKM